ncbi:VirB6/TrbL-like conjugal transfer protein, CD1112 family [Metabacillus fastidiosus]|uniref:VirB6/TrbL-like conjugal transfer protein, CD1112 family n=1 Tax=Metabacillus fastidiosus TaxID=1458 RepID=UPI002E222F88|nr:CD0415/CD1112 family protein [Metabacillus fastidiosus]
MFGWLDDIKEFIFDMFKDGTKSFLDMTTELFQKSIDTVQTNVSETPSEFNAGLVDNLRLISETAILPVAGLIITYVFCYEIYQMVVEKNRGGDFETGQMLFLIIKTSAMILLVTNSFTITLAIFDLGKWITNHVPAETLTIPESVADDIVGNIPEGEIGTALSMWLVAAITLVVTFIMSGIIYLVAWGRIIAILLYISVAPLPFATFLSGQWVGSVGQSYVKNLVALMLQGYFMLVCLVVYAGLLEKVSKLITTEGTGLYGLMLMLVSMGILVVTLTRTHSLAKSVVGAF